MSLRNLVAGLSLALPMACHAALVVSFPGSERYSDAGTFPADVRRNLDEIARHLERLGERYLAANETLTIEVLDVDLAGEVRPGRGGNDLRVMRGAADFPRIRLRYRLQGGARARSEADETVADMGYLQRTSRGGTSDPLRYEKQMLDDWFKARFAAQKR